MANWNHLNRCRVASGIYGSTPDYGFNGMFVIDFNGVSLRVLASDGMGWRHVSVSIANKPNQIPSWKMMCHVKDLFWDPESWVMQFHPAASEYVNHHPGRLHLWEPLTELFPKPPSILTGLK